MLVAWAALLALLGVLVALALRPGRLRFGVRLIERYPSPRSSNLQVWHLPDGEKWLVARECVQGISAQEERMEWSYWAVIADQVLAHCAGRPRSNVLVLGLGANTSSALIARRSKEIDQIIVEIDPLVVQVCIDHFGLREQPRTCVVVADAYRFLSERAEALSAHFDAVVVDLLGDPSSLREPPSSTPSFLRDLARCSSVGALMVFNQPAHTPEARAQSRVLQARLESLAVRVEAHRVEDPRGFLNDVLCAWTPFDGRML